MKEIDKHFVHYIPLFGIFIAVIIGYLNFSYDKSFQIIISVAAAVSYVVWGLVHHLIHKDLNMEVAIEYLVVALLGLTIVFSVVI